MKTYIRLLIMIFLVVAAGCQGANGLKQKAEEQPKPKFGPYPNIDRSRIYGMGYAVTLLRFYDGFSHQQAVEGMEIMKMLGAKTWRCWMHTQMLLNDPVTPNEEKVKVIKEYIRIAQKDDIVVIGMNHNWFNGIADPNAAGYGDDLAMPERDITPGSGYMKLLDNYRISWKTIANLFPEISTWEVGNEWNLSMFMHPLDYLKTGGQHEFTWEEKADITIDMLWAANEGIREVNPGATIIMPAAAPAWREDGQKIFEGREVAGLNLTSSGMPAFLYMLYERIKSGQWPSTEPDDYFDALAWHPYFQSKPIDQKWVELNDDVYAVACYFGDEGKPVYLTEWGVSEGGYAKRIERNAEYLVNGYKLIEEQMPYVVTMNYYRLYMDRSSEQINDPSGPALAYFGLYTEPEEGNKPRLKAIKYQEAAGGKGDLYKFTDKDLAARTEEIPTKAEDK